MKSYLEKNFYIYFYVLAHIPMRWYTVYADGRTGRQQKERQEKNTMKKELYDEIITVASENELAGILRVATFDSDIMPSEFLKLVARVINIKEKCEEIGK